MLLGASLALGACGGAKKGPDKPAPAPTSSDGGELAAPLYGAPAPIEQPPSDNNGGDDSTAPGPGADGNAKPDAPIYGAPPDRRR